MKKSQTLTLSKKTYSYTILNSIEVDINVTENSYQLPLEELFTMAARINKKRSFLFVSKVLGKHLPIPANKGLLAAALLAVKYVESIKGLECKSKEQLITSFFQDDPSFQSHSFIPNKINPVIIGFAETATALGHAFFDCFTEGEFFHTTREEIHGLKPSVTFEEEHSHAISHRCYIPIEMIRNSREIILVDDEMTTGKTAINIIESIHSKFPRKEYTVVSILDWRSLEHKQQFTDLENKLGIKINIVSLIAGNVRIQPTNELVKKEDKNTVVYNEKASNEQISLAAFFNHSGYSSVTANRANFIKDTGRFGIESKVNQSLHMKITEAAAYLRKKRKGRKTLCLGTGEFMYIPMKLAAQLGENVYYQSTTRSPIHIENIPGYGARYGVSFSNPEEPKVSHFVYNIPPGEYDEVFVFFERETDYENIEEMLLQLQLLQIKSIKIVSFSGQQRCNI